MDSRTTDIRCLTILHCDGCGRLSAPLTQSCPECGCRFLHSVPCCGTGTIVSWRYVQGENCGSASARIPIIAIVELDEGPWLYTLIDSVRHTMPDKQSRVAFRCKEPGDRFPHFSLT